MKSQLAAIPATPARGAAVADTLRFLGAWLRNPRQVAAVAPSGRALAALITRHIGPDSGPVLELGPGTGVFTQALIARGLSESDLTLVEREPQFAALLHRRFPAATVLRIDAAELAAAIPADADRFGAAICGLGLLSMPAWQVEAILANAFARMRPDAPLFLFTYGRTCSVSGAVLARLDLTATRIDATLRNMPPAAVYRLTRRG